MAIPVSTQLKPVDQRARDMASMGSRAPEEILAALAPKPDEEVALALEGMNPVEAIHLLWSLPTSAGSEFSLPPRPSGPSSGSSTTMLPAARSAGS
jgi:hypothetical protein